MAVIRAGISPTPYSDDGHAASIFQQYQGDTDTGGINLRSDQEDGYLFILVEGNRATNPKINDVTYINYYDKRPGFVFNPGPPPVTGTLFTSDEPINNVGGSTVNANQSFQEPDPVQTILTSTSLQTLKNVLPSGDPTDSSHDVRLAQILQQVEETVGAPNGMTQHVLREQNLSFYPQVFNGREIYIDIYPVYDIPSLKARDSSDKTIYPRARYYQEGRDRIILDQSVYNNSLEIMVYAGYMNGQVPLQLTAVIHQLVGIIFWNPDPSKQEIPPFIHNHLNRL